MKKKPNYRDIYRLPGGDITVILRSTKPLLTGKVPYKDNGLRSSRILQIYLYVQELCISEDCRRQVYDIQAELLCR